MVQHCNSRFGVAPSYALEALHGGLHLSKHCEMVEEGMSRASEVMLALSDYPRWARSDPSVCGTLRSA